MNTFLFLIKRKIKYRILLLFLGFFVSFLSASTTVLAEAVDYNEQAIQRQDLPIQSNNTMNWPEGPAVGAQAAIVMEADTGTILYAKNIHEELYPASTTKIMTCLLAVENANLNDRITFSHDAVFSVPHDGSSIGMDVGESITLEQALYGIMVGSANEVANAVAEHVSGSIDEFVKLMNSKAKELGCTNTHFANTNGLQDSNHYTSAYDLALIARAFFSNDYLCKIGNTARYHFIPTATQPDDFYLNNKHKLITGEYKYEGILGGKTGYTDQARETLVTCAEKNGMRLICVVLKEESPAQFSDTTKLFDYGFNNFHSLNIADNETRYMPNDSLFFESEHDVFGKSGSILKLDESSTVILPKASDIKDTDYTISYDIASEKENNPNAVAKVFYTFNGVSIGSAVIGFASQGSVDSNDSSIVSGTVYINVMFLFAISVAIVVIVTLIGIMSTHTNSNRKYKNKSDRIRYNRRKREFKKGKFRF